MNSIGLNILAQFVKDRQRLFTYIGQLQPQAVVVMDDIGTADHIRTVSPNTLVIYRAYHEKDAEFHKGWMSPEDWIARYAGWGHNGIIVQALNEPSGWEPLSKLVDWCVRVMQLARQCGICVCLPNFAVSHPDTIRIAELDRLLKAFDEMPEHILGVHEYGQQSTSKECPGRIGRYRAILKRAADLNLRPPQIVVTEYGRDVGGAENDGWRAVHWSDEHYADFLKEGLTVYQADSIPVCIFCYGSNPRWTQFDVEGASDLLNLLLTSKPVAPLDTPKADPVQPVIPVVPPPLQAPLVKTDGLLPGEVLKMPGTFVNVREGAGVEFKVVGTLRKGAKIKVAKGWVYVETDSFKGWVSLQGGKVEIG